MTAVVPNQDGLLLFQPVEVTWGFMAGSIPGIALVNRPHRYPVVIVGSRVLWRSLGIRERYFKRRHHRVVPHLWDIRRISLRRGGLSVRAERKRAQGNQNNAP